MRGWIEKRGSSYRVNIELDRAPDGERKYIRKTLKGVKKKEADAELTKMLHELNTGTFIEPTKMTYGEYLDTWLPIHGKNIAISSLDRYKREIDNRIKPVIGHIPLEKITPLTIQNFLDEIERKGCLKGNKPLSVEVLKINLRVIKKSLKQANHWEMLPRNPAANVSMPKTTVTKEMRILTEEQIKDVLATLRADKKYQRYALILLLVSTGLRLGEALALTWEDLDLTEGIVHVNKTIQYVDGRVIIGPPKTVSSNRKVPIDAEVVAVLKRCHTKQKENKLALGDKWRGTGTVFTGPTGITTLAVTVRYWWGRTCLHHGLGGVRIHDIRHTHATHLLASGKLDIKTIASRLGHKNAAMTLNTYSHVLPAKEKEAASVLAHLWT